MFNIDMNGNIRISRGDDSPNILLFINASGTRSKLIRHILGEQDKIYLGVYSPNSCFEHSEIKQIYTKDDLNEDGDLKICFKRKETKDMVPGLYYYQIKAKLNDEEVNGTIEEQFDNYAVTTIVEEHKFEIV